MEAHRVESGRLRDVGIVVVLIALHLGIVASVAFDERPVIWPLHNDTIHRVGRGADFYAVYHAAMNLQQGRGPYSEKPDGVTPYWYPFRYLPVVAIMFQPFTRLPPTMAYLAWLIITELILAALIVVLWRRSPPGYRRLFAAGALLLSSPYFLELYMGQFTFVTLALCYLGLLLPWGAALFSLSAVLKIFSLATVPALVIQPRYRLHVLLTFAILAAVSIPHFVNYPGQWQYFLNVNFRPEGGLHSGNYGLARLLHLLRKDIGLQITPDEWLNWTGTFRWMVLATTAGLVLLSRQSSPLVGASALLLAHFVTYQHIWEHHLSGVVAIGAVLLLSGSRKLEPALTMSMLALALPTLFGVFDTAKDPSVFDPSVSWPSWASYLVVLPKVVATIALYAISISLLFQDGLRLPRAMLGKITAQPSARGHSAAHN